MLLQLMKEMCRVAKEKVFLFERIEKTIKGDELCYGRPVDYYADICRRNGFDLESVKFINIRISYYVCGAIRKGLNPSSRAEGEPLNKGSVFLENILLPVTRVLDRGFVSRKDIARLVFKRVRSI